MKCQNPWKNNCKNTNILVYLMFEGKEKGICRKCWNKIADSDQEWGTDKKPKGFQ